MTPQKLKNSILQLAIQGKLVEQRSEEGTAKELFARIQEEKQRLIAEKKIKKEKPLPEISDDEKLFDIPESWMWVRLGDLFQHNTGKALNSTNRDGRSLTYITTSNLYWNKFELANLKEMFFTDTEVEKCTVKKGDLLVCEGGDFGRAAIWESDENIRIQNHIHRLRAYSEVCTKFFYYLFYLYKHAGWIGGKGIGIQGLSSKAIHVIVFPLPPLAEQNRIVAKIEELLPYIDRYEQAWSKLEQFNSHFPEDMKKSLLQYAIQGKLVEQRHEEGTAEELLARIQEEKQRLITEKKIKREKLLPEIIEDEKPFDVPESWKWVYLVDLVEEKPSNGYSPKGVTYPTEIRNLTLTATTSGKFKDDAFKYVDIPEEDASKYWLKNNDLLIQRSNSRELVGTSCIYTGADNAYIYPDLMMRMRVLDGVDVQYIDYVLKSPMTRNYYMASASGTSESMPKINQKIVSFTLVPLPPLAEQKRIVKKLELLLPLCERLK